jgi:hypothetical protein
MSAPEVQRRRRIVAALLVGIVVAYAASLFVVYEVVISIF